MRALKRDMEVRAEPGSSSISVRSSGVISVGSSELSLSLPSAVSPRISATSSTERARRDRVDSIIADVRAREHDLARPARDQLAHLREKPRGRQAPARAAAVGDDAIGAEGVAAFLDLEKRARARRRGDRRFRREARGRRRRRPATRDRADGARGSPRSRGRRRGAQLLAAEQPLIPILIPPPSLSWPAPPSRAPACRDCR